MTVPDAADVSMTAPSCLPWDSLQLLESLGGHLGSEPEYRDCDYDMLYAHDRATGSL